MCCVSGRLYRLPPWYVTSKHEGGVVQRSSQCWYPIPFDDEEMWHRTC